MRTVTLCYSELRDALKPLLAGLQPHEDVAFGPWAQRCTEAVWDLLLETCAGHDQFDNTAAAL